MCGIAGLLSHPQSPVKIELMQAAIRHRGPDDEGIYLSENRLSAIAHTRLSIIDLSAAGHQPMASSDGRYQIVFNGEIYNFRELRQQLVERGEKFNSQTDTEVILKLYQREGEACVDRLRGMFAFAIWDEWEQSCFLARDPLGIKPLYYARVGSTLAFASELKAILAAKLLPVRMSALGLQGYLTTGSVPEPQTIVAGIDCLPAGHWLRWHDDTMHQHRYWQIAFGCDPISAEDSQARVRQAVIDSIDRHFVGDVPVGIFLSGGIDSTALVALSRLSQSSDLQTYSIAFAEAEWNEGTLAQKTAAHFGTQHHEFCLSASDAKQLLPKFLASLDRPSIDGFNTFCVSQLAHSCGSKVVLSGLGGDEIFGGYNLFQKVPQIVRASRALQPVAPLRALVGMGLSRWSPQPQLKRLGEYLQRPPNVTNGLRAMRGIFTSAEAETIARQYLTDSELPKFPPTEHTSFPSLEDEVSALELSGYMRNQLLPDSDVASMAWGLELRVPFVDRILIETVANIPSELRLAPGKNILIQAIPELPKWVVNSPKRGFVFPFQKWFEDGWQSDFSHLQIPPGIDVNLWYRRWSLIILDYWWRQNAC